jgi:hypothetical protein
VVQTSKRFVVRGGEIPLEAAQSSPILHLVLLVMTLAGLVVMCRLVANFMVPKRHTFQQGNTNPGGCMFKLICPHITSKTSAIGPERLSANTTSGAQYSTRLDISPAV